MATVVLDGTSAGEVVRTPSPRTENGVNTGSTERQQPKADGTGSEEVDGLNKLSSVDGSGPKDEEGVANYDEEQRGREDHSTLLPNGLHSAMSGVQAGDTSYGPGYGSTTGGGVQLRHNSSGISRVRPMSFYLQSQHGLLLKEEMKVEGERMAVWLGEESIAWEGGRTGRAHCLRFADVFAATPIYSKQSEVTNSYFCEDETSGKSSTIFRRKGKKDTHNSATVPKQEMKGFVLHSLNPSKPGHVMKVQFMCSSPEMSTTWLESIRTQMQEFGARPRKLFVVVNPVSGRGNGLHTWLEVQKLFELAEVEVDFVVSKKKGYGREVAQLLNCSKYDGIIGVGGDGLFNELLNGLLFHAQFRAGVNLKRARFIPVQPTIPLGMVPCGHTNTLSHSTLSSAHPVTAAVQIILGRSVPLDVCSVTSNGQLMMFSGCLLNYGMHNISLLPRPEDLSWLDDKISSLGKKFIKKSFEATLMYVPSPSASVGEEGGGEPSSLPPCSSLCQLCALCEEGDAEVDRVPVTSHVTLATAAATFGEVDRADSHEWRTLMGKFHSITVAPYLCASSRHPLGVSPDGHFGDGCIDIIAKRSASARLTRVLTGHGSLPNVEIIKAREVKFDACIKSSIRRTRETISPASTEDEDEKTNRIASKKPPKPSTSAGRSQTPQYTLSATTEVRRPHSTGSETDSSDGGVDLPPGCWVVDGDVTNMSNVEIRVHRQLVTVFGFKPPPVVKRLAHPTKGALGSMPEGAEQSACSVRERALSEQDYVMVDILSSSPTSTEAADDSTQVEGSGADRPTA